MFFPHICKSLHFWWPSVHFLFPRIQSRVQFQILYFFPFLYSSKFWFFFNSRKSPWPNSIPSEVIATYFSYISSRFSSLYPHVPVLINAAPDATHAGVTISVNLPSVIILIPTESSFYPKGSETHSVEMIVISFCDFKLFCSQFAGWLWEECYSQTTIWLRQRLGKHSESISILPLLRNPAQIFHYFILFTNFLGQALLSCP